MVNTRSTRAIKLKDIILNQLVDEVEKSLFYVKFERAFEKCIQSIAGSNIQQIICYGLGNMHNGIDLPSRYQLALLVVIHRKLSTLDLLVDKTVEIYDPKFDEHDLETLKAFEVPKFEILTENEHCCRRLGNCLNYHLFYMPHVDYHLYNNLLGVNWNADDLAKLIILGNSFTEMIDHSLRYSRPEELCYLSALVHNFLPRLYEKRLGKRRRKTTNKEEIEDKEVGALIEYQVTSDFDALDSAFNQLSFHIVSRNWLAETINHTSIRDSNPRGWSPSIITESNDWFSDQ